MRVTPFDQNLFQNRLRSASRGLFWVGLAMLVVGIAAVVFPFVSTLVVALLVGWVILLTGCITLVGSFSIHGTGPFFAALLLSLLSIAAGVFLLFNPLAGAMALTVLLAVIFILQGAFETALAFEMRPLPGWTGMLVSGICSIVLAVIIAAGWPQISGVVLGLLLGVNFISSGLGYMFISRALNHTV
jgi:uncharacterized membrane protein HdeD (DUF308 family)